MKLKPLLVLFLFLSLIVVPILASYNPYQGDTFTYYETQNVGNGTGTYSGYTDQTVITGTETVNSVANGIVSASYSWSSTWNDNQGDPTQNNVSSGSFQFSSTTFLYTNGTDDQEGYVNPTVWFCMNSSLPEGSTFQLLNTLMTVVSTNYSYSLSSGNVQTIYAQGSGNYERNDAYGDFNAAYTWNTYFDPTSGYIVGYSYSEQDTNSSAGFTLNDSLNITSSSYGLTTIPEYGPTNVVFFAILVIVAIIVLLIIIIALATRRSRKPEQSNISESLPTKPAPNAKCPKCAAPIYIGDEGMAKCEYCGTEVHRQ